jgi:AcrR family transcriptional regulator
MRDAILDAARDLTVGRGWGNVRMADVATAAGVSRRTVYNEFATRDRLAEAMVEREVTWFLGGINDLLETDEGDLHDTVERAVTFALRTAADNPLIKTVATSTGDDSLLPYLTTDAGLVLRAARDLIERYTRRRLPCAPPERISAGADVLARVVLSNILLPGAPVEQVAAHLADVAEIYIEGVTAEDGA